MKQRKADPWKAVAKVHGTQVWEVQIAAASRHAQEARFFIARGYVREAVRELEQATDLAQRALQEKLDIAVGRK